MQDFYPRPRRRLLVPVVLAGVLAGCSAGAGRVRFVSSFVPPEPSPRVEHFLVPEPPQWEVGSAREGPLKLEAKLLATPGQAVDVSMRLHKAEERFQSGSELLAKGDAAGARALFDEAVEALVSGPAAFPGSEPLAGKYQELVEAVYRLEIETAGLSGTEPEPVYDQSPLDELVEMTFPLEPGLKGKVKEQLEATVSQLPLEMADPVLSFINYFSSTKGKKVLVAGLQRAGRYTPMIRRILDEEGVPQELIFLAQAESGFLPRAVSRKQATGMWQFILSRGREYGLERTVATDDRLDPEKATRAAARHLRDLYTQFGDWYLAIAAYNCGPMNVERAVQRTGHADFWELHERRALPRETLNYLPIILAMTIMGKNPQAYGLDEVTPDPALEYDTVRVSAASHLALIADIAEVPLSTMRTLNPAVLKLIAPADYEVRVPKGTARMVLAAMATIPPELRASWRVHRVSPAETVAAIAKKYQTTPKLIAAANGGADIEPEEGDLLVVPVMYPGGRPAPRSR